MRKLIHLLLFLVMASWLAMIVAPGMAGMSAFTQLPEHQAEIAQYRDFFGSDHKGMGQLVAGYVTAPIFAFSDVAQWILAPLALLLVLLECRPLRILNGVGQYVCLVSITAALGLVLLHNVTMAPSMNADMAVYRDAITKNDVEQAGAAKARFNEYHATAESLYGIRLVLVLVGIGALAVSSTPNAPTTGRER